MFASVESAGLMVRQAALREVLHSPHCYLLAEVDSTNEWLLQRHAEFAGLKAESGGVGGIAVCQADVQTAGRGQCGRQWHGQIGASCLLSVAGYLSAAVVRDVPLSLLAGAAVADVLESAAGLEEGTVGLKWPNDLVVAAADSVAKLGGILVESRYLSGAELLWCVIGVGVNVLTTPEKAVTSGYRGACLSDLGGGQAAVETDHLAHSIALALQRVMADLQVDAGQCWDDRYFSVWQRRDWLLGRRVSVEALNMVGQAAGADVAGNLLIASDDKVHRVSVGAASVCLL